jgi:CheY-like chemotaxis protein
MRCPVLVVDDVESVRDAIACALEDEGYPVQQAEDGHRALAILRASPRPHVVLLDYKMPGLDGAGVLAAVAGDAALAARDAYILSSAYSRTLPRPLATLLARMGARVLPKPFDLEDLFEAVAAACRGLAHAR